MYALLNVYFYGTKFNENLATSFKYLLQVDDAGLYYLFRAENTKFSRFIEKHVINKTTEFYKSKFFCEMKDTQLTKQCSFAQIAFGQWSSNAITSMPMYNMDQYLKNLN